MGVDGIGGPGFGAGFGAGYGPGVFPVVGAAVPLIPWAVGPWFGGDDGGEWDNWDDDGDDDFGCRDNCHLVCKGRCNEVDNGCGCNRDDRRFSDSDEDKKVSKVSKRTKNIANAKAKLKAIRDIKIPDAVLKNK